MILLIRRVESQMFTKLDGGMVYGDSLLPNFAFFFLFVCFFTSKTHDKHQSVSFTLLAREPQSCCYIFHLFLRDTYLKRSKSFCCSSAVAVCCCQLKFSSPSQPMTVCDSVCVCVCEATCLPQTEDLTTGRS